METNKQKEPLGGIGLETEERVPIHTIAVVETATQRFRVRIVHCTRMPSGKWRVGCEVLEELDVNEPTELEATHES